MLTTKRLVLRTLILLVVFYVLICIGLYFFQERLIFFPEKLDKGYKFSFDQSYEELNIQTNTGKFLHGLLFRSVSAKGLVFYLHGNAGAVNSWGEVAKSYTDLNYDVFVLDYPGYGKSDGAISSEDELHKVLQDAYNEMKKKYKEETIVVMGYSIGTGPATRLASVNHPKLLILHAPYYSLIDMMRRRYPIIPTFILKYKFRTNEYIKECKMPVVIFHGNKDEVIYHGSSLKLQKLLKATDTMITLNGQGHNGIEDNPEYKIAIAETLSQ